MTQAEGLKAIFYLQRHRERILEELALVQKESGDWEVIAMIGLDEFALRDYGELEAWVQALPT